jgi:uncharacterized membrane protein
MAGQKKPLSEVLGVGQIEPEIGPSNLINVGSTERILSAAGGALLFTYGLRQGSLSGLLLAAIGGGLIFRGASGYCPYNNAIGRNTAEDEKVVDAIEITKSLTINKPRAEVYRYWRKLENLPIFMEHLAEVNEIAPNRSHWKAKIPGAGFAGSLGTIEWEALIVDEAENERLIWKSIEGASVNNAGEIRFADGPDGSTQLSAVIQYRPPAGALGETVSKLFNPAFKAMITNDLLRFKQLMETGSIAHITG